MNGSTSSNTQAILLLTAPLLLGQGRQPSELLSPGEYNRLARVLHDNDSEPADLLGTARTELVALLGRTFDAERLTRLLGRGFLLGQAIERWTARSIWVVSRADPSYPRRLRERLKDAAPALLYGCGDATLLNSGGLAIVGSRHASSELIEYAERTGSLAARGNVAVVSGGARGIDQAGMRGALSAGGRAIGALADGLERLAIARDSREFLMDRRLVLASAYDPAAGFDVGNAMQRNKLIYALADAALIVESDYQSGGTWAGAIEQLEKLRLVPVYVRSDVGIGKGLQALLQRGALSWPSPSSADEFAALSDRAVPTGRGPEQAELSMDVSRQPAKNFESPPPAVAVRSPSAIIQTTPADELFARVKELLQTMTTPRTVDEVAAVLDVSESQARKWLNRLVKEQVLSKQRKPVRYYAPANRQENLFGAHDSNRG